MRERFNEIKARKYGELKGIDGADEKFLIQMFNDLNWLIAQMMIVIDLSRSKEPPRCPGCGWTVKIHNDLKCLNKTCSLRLGA